MNSRDTVLAVMKDVQGLRDHDRKTGQDARWQGLDKVPDAAMHSLKMHGGRLTHKVLLSSFSKSTTDSGVKIDRGVVLVRFSIFGSDLGEPVTDEAWVADTSTGENASAKVYKRALRTFFVDLLQLPSDRAVAGDEFFERTDAGRYLAKALRAPKLSTRKTSPVRDIPWSPRTEALGAQIAFLTMDEYAVEWARYYIDSLWIGDDPNHRLELVDKLLSEGFTESQAEHGVVQNGL
jgi:hypothetical protein